MQLLRTNTATRVTVGPFFDKTDGVTPETAITVTSCKLTFIVDDGGVPTLVLDTAPTASGGSNDMVHITGDDAGYYDLELAAANVNYLGRAKLAITDAATHCPVFHEFMIVPAMIYDAMVLGTDVLQADVTQLLGTAWLTPGTAGTPDVNTKTISNDAITAASIAANAIDRATFAADTGLQTVRSNTAQAGGAATITLDASASATNDFYNGNRIYITGGTGVGQSQLIYDYVGATKVASVTPGWATAPDNTSTFAIISQAEVDVGLWLTELPLQMASGYLRTDTYRLSGQTASTSGTVTFPNAMLASSTNVAAVEADTQDIQSRLPAALSSGNMKSDVLAINTVTASAARLALSAGVIIPGTVDSTGFTATTTEFEADDVTEATADHYNGRIIIFTSGALLGQATSISDYALATGRGHFTVTALTEAPANNDTFIIV